MWGFGLANDHKGRNRRRWDALRRKAGAKPAKGLTGKALDNAVLALAAADPSLVKFEQAGA